MAASRRGDYQAGRARLRTQSQSSGRVHGRSGGGVCRESLGQGREKQGTRENEVHFL